MPHPTLPEGATPGDVRPGPAATGDVRSDPAATRHVRGVSAACDQATLRTPSARAPGADQQLADAPSASDSPAAAPPFAATPAVPPAAVPPPDASRDAPPGDAQIEAELLRLCAARGPQRSFCPSEAARALLPETAAQGPRWQSLMGPVRRVAFALARRGVLQVLRKGRVIDPAAAAVVIRLRASPDPAEGPA